MAAAAAQQPQQQPSSGQARWVPSLPASLLASLNPFATAEDPKHVADNGDKQRPTLAMLGQNPVDSLPPSPTKSTGSIMFAEPESQGTSMSGSREGSIDAKRRAKRNSKPKTAYSICHPPPTSSARQKLHRRPRSLLQLHKLTTNARPVPAYEVIPSANFSVRLTRATTKVFRAKHSLCPSDLVVLRAEDYFTDEPDEEQEARDVVALICKGRKEDGVATGKAKICMADGEEWEATALSNGSYEFSATDAHGLGSTVRWVPKKGRKDGAKPESKRFNFSTISANTRRHPIIANLSKSSLAIHDSYKMPDCSSTTPQATPKQHATTLEDEMDSEDNTSSSKQEVRTTDPRLRSIIAMTSIYVTFKEGWSPSFKYDDPAPTSAGSRRNSVHTPTSTPPTSPIPVALDKRASILSVSSSLFRKSSLRSRAPTHSSADQTRSNDASPNRSPSHRTTGRSRADSTSTVLVHRAASNRRNNRSQATWRPDLLSAGKQQEVAETSREGTPVNETKPEYRPVQQSREPSRNASVATGNDPESESEAEEGRGQAPSAGREMAERGNPDTRASSNATSDSGNGKGNGVGGGPAQKRIFRVSQTEQRKGKKWKKWICGKF